MISSYWFKFAGIVFMLAAIPAEKEKEVVLLIVAYAFVSIAWYISVSRKCRGTN